jgi:predicted Rossmann-fold nucleotide-binding protein
MMPGGFGTMDEFLETITLVQTQKVNRIPMVLVGSEYWGGLVDWIRQVMLEKEGNISPGDMDLFTIVDTAEDVVAHVLDFYTKHKLEPNF